MRYFRLTLLLLLLFFSGSASFAQSGKYLISGHVNAALNISEIYFSQAAFYSSEVPAVQRIPVSGGRFSISGSIAGPQPGFLSLDKDLEPKDAADLKQFLLDTGKISIHIDGELSAASITGSRANDDMLRYSSGQQPFVKKITALNEAAQRDIDAKIPPDSVAEIYHRPMKQASEELSEYQRRFIRDNPDAFISLLLVPEIARISYNFFEADSIFNGLGEALKKGDTGKAISGYLNEQKKTSIGALAPEFALSDTAGRMVSLSSFRGKYLLLDFWAAWCAPCREENPNVVHAYHTYKGRGFTVLGVSLDRNRKDWLRAIHDDRLTWDHLSDLKFWKSEPAVIYGVQSIPRNFLLDPEGKIIGRDLRGPALNEKLEAIFRDR